MNLTNGTLKMHVHQPGAYYRGARFDWSGIIASVEYGGHKFFGEWKPSRTGTGHDDVTGPADDFLPVEEADRFLKVGIGYLRRPDSAPYRFNYPYEVIEPFPWRVEQGADWIEFRQQAPRYDYTKRIALTADGFTLRRQLKATQLLVTETYNHNFCVFDDQPVSPRHRVELPFTAPVPLSLRGLAEIRDREIIFLKELPVNTALYSVLTGTGNEFAIRHGNTCIRVIGDSIAAKMIFYACGPAVCIEPYQNINLRPGECFTWTSDYEFTV